MLNTFFAGFLHFFSDNNYHSKHLNHYIVDLPIEWWRGWADVVGEFVQMRVTLAGLVWRQLLSSREQCLFEVTHRPHLLLAQSQEPTFYNYRQFFSFFINKVAILLLFYFDCLHRHREAPNTRYPCPKFVALTTWPRLAY